jgi:hypothetical protein
LRVVEHGPVVDGEVMFNVELADSFDAYRLAQQCVADPAWAREILEIARRASRNHSDSSSACERDGRLAEPSTSSSTSVTSSTSAIEAPAPNHEAREGIVEPAADGRERSQ